MAAGLAAASVIAASSACAHEPNGSWRSAERSGALGAILGKSWVELEAGPVAAGASPGLGGGFGTVRGPQMQIAGSTLRNLNGWSASLFVTHAAAGEYASDQTVLLPDSTAVNARLARRVWRNTSVTLDAFNLFDTHGSPLDEFVASQLWTSGGMPKDYLVHPGERRGVRLGIRWTFR
ncbi:MAG TPA: hypothetical protein VLY46_09685 [Usitatibacter sp.]|nr:hypothetical protein [Usitatibacter sp.]